MNDGASTDDVVLGSPCVGIWAVKDHNTVPEHPTKTLALVDTGADHVYADPAVLASIGAPIIGSARGVNGSKNDHPIHQMGIIFPGFATVFSVRAIARDFSSEGRSAYQVVLGRSILRYFDVRFSPRIRNECYLEIPAQLA